MVEPDERMGLLGMNPAQMFAIQRQMMAGPQETPMSRGAAGAGESLSSRRGNRQL